MVMSNRSSEFLKISQSFSLDIGSFFTNFHSSPHKDVFIYFGLWSIQAQKGTELKGWTNVEATHTGQLIAVTSKLYV